MCVLIRFFCILLQLPYREIALVRDVYEVAALLSVKEGDDSSFERHVAQAKTYYVDYARALDPSSRQNLILGLNLVRLMAQNRIAEFHTELELVPPEARNDKYIDYALRLEHYLMEGSYSKMREEKDAMPDQAFGHFVDALMITVRKEIAACCERAYDRLDVKAAARMLSLESEDSLHDFCDQHDWVVDENTIVFGRDTETSSKMENVPSSELIKRSLEYARELEQII